MSPHTSTNDRGMMTKVDLLKNLEKAQREIMQEQILEIKEETTKALNTIKKGISIHYLTISGAIFS